MNAEKNTGSFLATMPGPQSKSFTARMSVFLHRSLDTAHPRTETLVARTIAFLRRLQVRTLMVVKGSASRVETPFRVLITFQHHAFVCIVSPVLYEKTSLWAFLLSCAPSQTFARAHDESVLQHLQQMLELCYGKRAHGGYNFDEFFAFERSHAHWPRIDFTLALHASLGKPVDNLPTPRKTTSLRTGQIYRCMNHRQDSDALLRRKHLHTYKRISFKI